MIEILNTSTTHTHSTVSVLPFRQISISFLIDKPSLKSPVLFEIFSTSIFFKVRQPEKPVSPSLQQLCKVLQGNTFSQVWFETAT